MNKLFQKYDIVQLTLPSECYTSLQLQSRQRVTKKALYPGSLELLRQQSVKQSSTLRTTDSNRKPWTIPHNV
ncbi:hypothetical protein AMS68_000408 [Peltaster fructicola]|uniref:Uncharacterized protein n=1 Tax=Peltaster fructicola TaxID=286661 RepID=A0A6H0XJR9_9PEZI|nr:hypothetical protein AMS68_000408 [Peltaster fructicola]